MKRIFLILSVFFAFTCQAQMMNNAMLGRGEVNVLEQGNAFWLATHRLSTMYQEAGSSGSYPQTPVTTDGNPVGFIYDIATGSFCRNPEGTTQRPVLGSDATINSFLTFDGTNDRTAVQAGSKYFKPIWSTNPVFTFMFMIKMNGGNAANQRPFMNNDASATASGFHTLRNTSNKFSFSAVASGGSYYTVTSTTNFTVAAGWLKVIVSVNGTGTGAGRFIVIDASGATIEDQAFNVSGTGDNTDASQAFYIGGRSAGPQYFNGSLAHFIVKPVAVTDQIIDAYAVYNPARTSVEFSPIVERIYAPSDVNSLWEDAAKTTHPADGDIVRVMDNKKVSPFGDFDRNATAPSDAQSPIYRAAQQNGLGTIQFDSVNRNRMQFGINLTGELGGKYVFFVVVRNNDEWYGSQFLNTNGLGSTNFGRYMVVTGSKYSSPGIGLPRAVVHPIGTEAVGIASVYQGSDNCEVYAVRRVGPTFTIWNQSGAQTDYTVTDQLGLTFLGGDDSGLVDYEWFSEIYFSYLAKYAGYMSDNEVEAIMDELVSLYGLWIFIFPFDSLLFWRRKKKEYKNAA